ncbi:MAG TPA: peptidoglycan-binding domain-containing protein [Pyrinomonadaceae bacterium]|nr:peptidoglycan-binding domain-containing protein [Pyrinomonadaceae bacterium]
MKGILTNMPINWLSNVFNFNVERKEIPRPGNKPYIQMAPNGVGVLHTTEGFGADSAWNTLNAKHSAPHFVVGDNRIIQCRPLGVQAAALLDTPLHPNKDAYVQIEMCGFTGGNKDFAKHAMDQWSPDDSTLQPLAALMAWLHKENIIPLQRAFDWPDDASDMQGIWARANNTRRLQKIYGDPQHKGWFYHMEVPGNNHYDCGAMRCADVFTLAKTFLGQDASQPDQPSTDETLTPDAGALTAILRNGDRGDNVKQLQSRLIALGFLAQGQDDGIFGQKTLDAVRKFQSANGLSADGVVGPATNKALSGASQASSGGN